MFNQNPKENPFQNNFQIHIYPFFFFFNGDYQKTRKLKLNKTELISSLLLMCTYIY